MELQEQKIDAFNKIKQVVDKHNLDISDQEIYECVEDLLKTKPISYILSKCSAEESIKVINQQMGTDFTVDMPLCDILDKISEKWNSL